MASFLPGITVVVIGCFVVHHSVIPGVLVLVAMLVVVSVTVVTVERVT